MPFPPKDRVFYEKTPLEEVVCQLRFPPILRIDAEVPVAFQDAVRRIFPLYERTAGLPNVPFTLPPQFMQAMAQGSGAHEFSSADGDWKLSLARDFIALTTRSYVDWADFRQKFSEPLQALCTVYSPAFFSRAGLRYRNRIDRDAFELGATPWHELLRTEALGELADPTIGPAVQVMLRELVLQLDEQSGFVRIVHGLERTAEKAVYIIDSDFFVESRTELNGVQDVLDAYNRRAGDLFRWYITDRLHESMGPRPT